jgi:hypothetical protein
MNNYHTILNGIQRRIIRAYQQRNLEKLRKLNDWKFWFTVNYL